MFICLGISEICLWVKIWKSCLVSSANVSSSFYQPVDIMQKSEDIHLNAPRLRFWNKQFLKSLLKLLWNTNKTYTFKRFKWRIKQYMYFSLRQSRNKVVFISNYFKWLKNWMTLKINIYLKFVCDIKYDKVVLCRLPTRLSMRPIMSVSTFITAFFFYLKKNYDIIVLFVNIILNEKCILDRLDAVPNFLYFSAWAPYNPKWCGTFRGPSTLLRMRRCVVHYASIPPAGALTTEKLKGYLV